MGNNVSIAPSSREKQSIYEEILHENHIRQNAQMPQYNVQTEYAARLGRLHRKKYRELLTPYLLECLTELPKSNGLVQRLGTQEKAELCATKRLYDDTGIEPVDGALPNFTDRLVTWELATGSG